MRILLVEDDPAVAKILELALGRAGHAPFLVRDYPSARAALARDWDAVVLDLNLPGGAGLDLLRHLRQELGKDTPVVVLSGLKQERNMAQALALGAQAYLTKPFSPGELLKLLERHVAAR
ncbi:MAG: response regulator transcription factor [Thermus sp.]|uniref:response regulator transcription factor n=1 Tax=Thermus sp. TaxID=275 RepID=UPI0025CDEA3D|nr:response regulator transcription factor [Thermus sp.]MCS6868312.1 response regulator transcription factor [Thermus sp.]MCS7218188.1 response regulator transcription factor [Thermus sp.]MCX7850043.1 response regulator transcription factor [Thermus sp.]MDW8017098.1 response regulator transcription factor [Thermus sp.]MDW8356368.1 response regulator transcription factor [Thermus sp.]